MISPGAFDRKICSSSVEPTPSRISTPKRAFQALPTDSGSASPAEVQMRKREPARSCFSVSSLSIAENNVGTPKKMVGLYLFISANITRRRRTLGIENGGGADRHRKRQRVAEAIGEKQFCRRQPDIVLANAEHLLRVGLGGRREIGMQVPHALGHAGRARRIQPERRLVGMGRGGRELNRFSLASSSDSFLWPCAFLPETMTCSRSGIRPTMSLTTGSSASETNSTRARQSAST